MSDLPARMIVRAARTIAGITPVLPSRYEASYLSPADFEVLHEVAVEPAAGSRHDAGEPPAAPIREEIQTDAAPKRPKGRNQPDAVVEVETKLPADRTSGPPLPVQTQPAGFTTQDGLPAHPVLAAHAREDGGEPAHRPQAQSWTEESRPVPPSIAREGNQLPAEVTLRLDSRKPGTGTELYSSAAPDASRSRVREDSPRGRREIEAPDAGPGQPVEVHVSIGHIEVRQAAPPATPKLRPAPVPHVRLEDYLKRRGDAR